MAKTPDRVQQVATTKEKHGDDFYQKIGKKGGENTPSKFTSTTGSENAKKRWKKYHEEKERKRKAEK